MGNPLRLLSKLRRFPENGNAEQYLKTEHRQNLKAIEDALRRLGVTLNDSASGAANSTANSIVVGPEITSATTSSGLFVSSGHTIQVQSIGSPIVLILGGIQALTAAGTGRFSISSATSSDFLLLRDPGATASDNYNLHYFKLDSSAEFIRAPIVVIDPMPPIGLQTYDWQFRKITGDPTIANAQLVGIPL